MINLELSSKELYFLSMQVENIVKVHPDNHIAKGILKKLVENRIECNDSKCEFQMEYDSIWFDDK